MSLRIPGLLAITTALVLSALATGVRAGVPSHGEYQVKAAFIYNFAKYVEWPADAFGSGSSPIVVTVLGNLPDPGALEAIRGKTVRGRKIELRTVKRVEEVGATHILLVSNTEKDHLSRILELSRRGAILTISDIEQFDRAGGIISFLTVDDKVRFQINLAAARKSGLRISAQLLKLARNIIE